MTKPLIVFSGPMGAGKTTLARHLKDHHGFLHINTREALANHAPGIPLSNSRDLLQDLGRALDKATGGNWIADHVLRSIQQSSTASPTASPAVLDCVRNTLQMASVARIQGVQLLHVHLTAPSGTLRSRYQQRFENIEYSQAASHPSEQGIDLLKPSAHLTVDTSTSTLDDAARRIIGAIPRD